MIGSDVSPLSNRPGFCPCLRLDKKDNHIIFLFEVMKTRDQHTHIDAPLSFNFECWGSALASGPRTHAMTPLPLCGAAWWLTRMTMGHTAGTATAQDSLAGDVDYVVDKV